MSELRFAWDVGKEAANLRKHGVSFTEAQSAFCNENALLIEDSDHSRPGDVRFVLLGLSDALRVLVVVHVYRASETVIRIISARRQRQPNARATAGGIAMRREYDFSGARKNPYAARLKRSVTIRLDERTIDHFKTLSTELDIPYQTLINLYLRDCAATKRRLSMHWRPSGGTRR